MVKKLSDIKVSKLFQLYFQGYSQVEIANKLKITQASVSIHVSKFKSLAGQQGIKAAAEEYGVMGEVELLYDLAVDLKKNKITVEEAKTGLKMSVLFQECGVEEEEYADLIQVCQKMNDEDYLFAAVELKQLEDTYGTSYEGIVAEYKSCANKLEQNQKELQDTNSKINSAKKDLENINKQKQLATQDLKAHMDEVGLDMHRLEMVEALALALKEGAVPDQELPDYLKRQQLLNKAGISINLLAMIIEKAKVITSQDHGKKLLALLSQYGNLSDTNKALQLQIESLTKQTADLDQQANLLGKIKVEIAQRKAEKASLEPQVADLYSQKDELKQVQDKLNYTQTEVNSLINIKGVLEQEISKLETYEDNLKKEIQIKEQKVSDLKEVESKRAAILKEIAELEVRVKDDRRRWDVYQGFLGLVQSTSQDELKKSAKTLPAIIESLPENTSVENIEFCKNYVVQDLTGGKLPFLLKCRTCGASIITDTTKSTGCYQCPNGEPFSPHDVIVEKNSLAMLKMALSPEMPKPTITVKPINISSTRTKNSDSKSQ